MGRYKMNFTLLKRGDYWYYRTYDMNGKRTNARSTGCKSKSKAKLYCEDLLLKGELVMSNDKFVPYAEALFEDGSSFLADRSTPFSSNTLRIRRTHIKVHIKPFFKNSKISEINYQKVKNFRAHLLVSLSPISVRLIFDTLNLILNELVYNGKLSSNPTQKLQALEVKVKKIEAFTVEEIKALKDKFYQVKDYNFVLFLALTGMRYSEAVGVTAEDIIEEENKYYIKLNKQYIERFKSYSPLKTKNERYIPIIPELKDCILGPDNAASSTVLKNAIHKIRGDKALVIHSLRHFFVSSAKSSGINNLKVEVIAGHSLRGIEKVYTEFSKEELNDILQWQKEIFEKIK